MNYKDIIADIEKKLFHPVYFFCGEEAFYIDMLSNAIEKGVLDETEREFNQFVFYGRENNLATVLDAAYRFPMMANHQVIIVKEAQDLKDLMPRTREGKKDKDDEKENLLSTYLDKPQKTTVLVFCYKYKTLASSIQYFNDTPSGFGAGMDFQTKAGIFSLSYAIGNSIGNPFNFGTGKINFGIVDYF